MKHLVILSGGMDSATLLWSLAAKGEAAEAISFDYGQRHSRELEAARRLAELAGVPHRVVDLRASFGAIVEGASALTGGGDVPEGHYEDETMRATVVPNRNMTMIALATARAIAIGAQAVAYGAHHGDHAIYPDCRAEFVEALAKAMGLCDYQPIELVAPFRNIGKHDVAELGHDLGVPFAETWSCYKGGAVHCGRCGTCVERKEAFALAGVPDPTIYEDPSPVEAFVK